MRCLRLRNCNLFDGCEPAYLGSHWAWLMPNLITLLNGTSRLLIQLSPLQIQTICQSPWCPPIVHGGGNYFSETGKRWWWMMCDFFEHRQFSQPITLQVPGSTVTARINSVLLELAYPNTGRAICFSERADQSTEATVLMMQVLG